MNTDSNSATDTVNDSAFVSALPAPIRDLVRIATAFNADPLTVTATGFAVAATALGASHRIGVPNAPAVLPGFNLVLVGAQNNGLPWLYPVEEPLLTRANKMVVEWSQDRGKTITKLYEGRNRDYQAAVSANQSPELLHIAELEVCRLRAAQKPFIFSMSMEPKLIHASKVRAFDSAVTVYPSCSDFFEEWVSLIPRDRRELNRLLNRSWHGTQELGPELNVFGTGVPSRTAANAVLGSPNPAPILFMPVAPVRRIETQVGTKDWSHVIDILFNMRCSEPKKAVAVAPGAEAELVRYGQDVGANSWLADLARRISFLCGLLGGTEFTAETARRGVVITRALAGAHNRAVAAMRPLTPAADVSTKLEEKLLALVTAKAPLTRQQLWRSLNDPKVATFNPALQNLINRGDVLIENKMLFART